MIQAYNGYFMFYPFLPPNCNKPPTVYSILNSIVNGLKEEDDYTKIKNLPEEGRTVIFDFDYPLSSKINKKDFEINILNHYLMRRIGFETVTAFKIQLNAKLNEIMPMYNKLFDLLYNNELFGEITKRQGFDNRVTENDNNTDTSNELKNNSKTNTKDISDRRNSELPQNQLENLRDGSYVTNYNYDTNTNEGTDTSTSTGKSNSKSKSTGTDNNNYEENISKVNLFEIYKSFNEEIKNIYTLIYKDLDILFYQLV